MTALPPPTIRAATPDEGEDLAHLIANAFHDLPICQWLTPQPVERMDILTRYFQLTVDQALTHGAVYTTAGRQGVAVWLPSAIPAPPDHVERLRAACAPWADRFEALEEAMDAHHPTHPTQSHDYLALLAVHPNHQGQGIGGALLTEHTRRLDRWGRPSYLEATNDDSARLYQRHGYVDIDAPITPAGCPAGASLRPMWRGGAPD